MINYSWAHAGIWSIAKRVLPAPALSRVFFPTQQELTDYFSPSMLPKGYRANSLITHLQNLMKA
jgi:retinaldehyde-binding protein 1